MQQPPWNSPQGFRPPPPPPPFPAWRPPPKPPSSGKGFAILLLIFAMFSGCSGALCLAMGVSPTTDGTPGDPGDKVISASPREAMDKARAPAKSFVRVAGTADLDYIGEAVHGSALDGYLFVITGEKRLVVYLPANDPLAKPVRDKEKTITLVLGQLRSFEGKIYDGGQYGGDSLPAVAIYQLVKKDLNLVETDVRVLNLGERPKAPTAAKPPPTPAQLESTRAMSFASSGVWALFMIVAAIGGIVLLRKKPQ